MPGSFPFATPVLALLFASLAHCASIQPFSLHLRPSSDLSSQSSLISSSRSIQRVHLGAPPQLQRMSLRGGGGVVSAAPRYFKLKKVMQELFTELDSDHDGQLSREEIKVNAKRFSAKLIECDVVGSASASAVDAQLEAFLAGVEEEEQQQSGLSFAQVERAFLRTSSFADEAALAQEVQHLTSAKRIDDLENTLWQLVKHS